MDPEVANAQCDLHRVIDMEITASSSIGSTEWLLVAGQGLPVSTNHDP